MPEPKRPLKVFLCHASTDKPKVRELYRYLKKRGIQPWFDEEDLVGGQDWQVEIPKALATSDAIIICLTKNSVDKEGYIQNEIKFALVKALGMPVGRIFLIPVKFEECEVPFTLSRYQWVDLTVESGYAKMMKALKFRASQLERSTVEVSKKDVEQENLARENKERESAEKDAHEKAENEAAEKAHLKIVEEERQRIAKEKAEREAVERARLNAEEQAKIKAAKEKAKRETEKNKEKLVAIKPKVASQIVYWFGGFIVLALGILLLYSLNNPTSAEQPTPENTQTQEIATLVQSTVAPSATTTPTSISTPASTLTPTPLPTEITDAKGVSMALVSSNDVKFYMDKYEVTNKLYKTCVNAGNCLRPIKEVGYTADANSNYPIVYVNQIMADTFCKWRDARLPTSDEWNMASEGYPWEKMNDCNYGNYVYGFKLSTGSTWTAKQSLYCVGHTISVGSYELGKSIFGIYDLLGNVSEWAGEVNSNGYYQVNGGSWNSYFSISENLILSEDINTSERANNTIGFRCAMDAP